MENFSDSPQLGSSSAFDHNPEHRLNQVLAQGLSALKRQDYAAAIADLQSVCQSTVRPSTVLKAQMGLVKAYEGIGQLEQAIALCNVIGQSPSQQAQSWARQVLQSLNERSKQEARPITTAPTSPYVDPTGFVPLTESEVTRQTSTPIPPGSDSTGFVPLDEPPYLNEAEDENPFVLPVDAEEFAPPSTDPLALAESATSSRATHPSLDAASSLDSAPTPSEETVEIPISDKPRWRQAGRAQRWSMLGTVNPWRLPVVQGITLVTLIWVLEGVIQGGVAVFNGVISHIKWPLALHRYVLRSIDPMWGIIYILVILVLASPWILEFILRRFYGLKPLPASRLETYSPEAKRVLKRVCSQQRIPLPHLQILPTSAPMALSYGFPRMARIAVSQGLLEQLADDEIATIYAGELGHIVNWDFMILSLVTLVAQIPYLVYWQASSWGDAIARRSTRPLMRNVFQGLAAVLSGLAYGLYWVCRCPGLWLARLRLYYSDRLAAEATGNPNGLTRALLKIANGIVDDVQSQAQTSPLLESFDLLTPVGYKTALSVGSLTEHTAIEPILNWDRSNPYRTWLTVNNAHPLMGDRLYIIERYARHWRLETELEFQPVAPGSSKQRTALFLLQAAPFLGMVGGLAIASVLGWIGIIADTWALSWLSSSPVLKLGLVLSGFSIGTILRINAFFPDITPGTLRNQPALPTLLAAPDALPIDSPPVSLEGRLLGRRGMGNWLGQDLILETPTGLIRLHYMSKLGPLGNLLPQPTRPDEMVNCAVRVTGWFRRGATLWLDVDTLRTQPTSRGLGSNRVIRSEHPVWSTLAALLAALFGAYIILVG